MRGTRRLVAGMIIATACAGFATAPAPLNAEGVVDTVHADVSIQNACTTRVVTPDGGPFLEPSEQSMTANVATDASPFPHGGQDIALTNTTVTVSLGAEIFQAGVETGLLRDGLVMPSVLDLTLEGTNTTVATQTISGAQNSKLEVLNGLAQPLTTTFSFPEAVWTPVDDEQMVTVQAASFTLTTTIPIFFDEGLRFIAECEPSGSPTLVTVNPSGKPSAPGAVQVEAGDGQVWVVWNEPDDPGSSPITAYHVAVFGSTGSPPTGITGSTTRVVSATENAMTFAGLKIGVPYKFRVAAESAAGVGPFSDASALATPLPFVAIGDASTFEGNAGNRALRFTVSLSAVSPKTVSVQYGTNSNSAKGGSDYVTKTGVVTIPAGKASAEVTVSVRGDLASEATESFFMSVGLATNARPGRSTATGRIVNDDPGPLARRVHIGDAGVVEGRTGTRALRLTVTLSATSSKKTTVRFHTSNGTANTSDYTKTSGLITIPAGRASAIVAVAIRGDAAKEANESFRVTLSQATGASLGRSIATATIYNDD